jgi:MarR family transcriptional regulator, organic hydroperoxide resistance regulator
MPTVAAQAVPGPPRTDPLSEQVANAFLQIANRHRQILHSSLGKHGVNPGQAICLRALAEQDGAAQSEIADVMNLSRPSVTRILQRMEKGGLVRRAVDPGDQRVTRVYLTARGRDLIGSLRAGFADYVSRTVALLPESDRVTLARILREWAELADAAAAAATAPEDAK